MKKLLSLTLLGFIAVSGCSTPLTGAGESGVGYRSETKVFLYHTVDGDKEGVEAKAELNIDPAMRALRQYKEIPSTTPDGE